MSVGTIYHIPFQLGVLGLRRSEIASLSHDNIKGNKLTIDSALVQNEDFEWVEKDTKTTDSTRTIYIPDCLVEEINNSEQILACHPNTLNKKLHDYQRKLGIPEFRFHDLRAFYVSYAHSCGIPDNIIMSNGGWKSETIMKRVYRRTIEEDAEYYQKALAKDLLG